MSNSVHSILGDILKSSSTSSGNTSWYQGSSSQPKVSSYLTVIKASKSNSDAAIVAHHFGIDPKNPKDKKKKHSESLLGSILGGAKDVGGNFVSDVVDTAEGTPGGLLKLATTNPVDSAKMIGADYAHRYGKLFHGDFAGFAKDVGKHPFGYLLDASALGTGGGAALGRLAPALAKGGEVALRVDRAASKAGAVENTTRQLSRNVYTRNVFEKPAYALQRTLPQSLPIFGERATAIRHITSQVEGKVGALGHANQVFEKTVRDIRHDAHKRKDDTLLQAFDRVSADIRHRPLQLFGQGLHTPEARAFNPKLDTNIAENGVRHSDEITQVADTIKSEIKLDEAGNLVAKDGASPATHSFLKVHNARESLNQSLVKTEELVGKVNPQTVAKSVAKTKSYKSPGYVVPTLDKGIPDTGLGVHTSPTTAEYISGSFKHTPGTPGKETVHNVKGSTFKAGGSSGTKVRIENPNYVEAGWKINSKGARTYTPSQGDRYIWVEDAGKSLNTFKTQGGQVVSRGQGTAGSYSHTPGHTVHTEGEAKFLQQGRKSNSPNTSKISKSSPAKNSGRLAQSTANKVAPKVESFLDGVRTVDTHSDPVSNYLEMHGKAIKSAGNAIAKGYLEKFGDNPRLANEITGIFDKHSPAGSLSGQYNKATQIWKDLILVGRPAFLVNNFVGNQAMYHLKQGLGGQSFQKAARGELNPAFETHFFEHRQSLGSSEKAAPRYNEHGTELEPSRYRRTANKVYNVQSRHEQILRKATMREAAMSIPAIKTEVRRLIGEKNLSEGDALNQAMTKAFKDNPGYREIIGKAIDDTMGNYRHYNRFEKGVKALVPFYGWNRHALRTYTSMIKDQPGRVVAISEIGLIGNRENARILPDTPNFMKTYVTGKLGTFDTHSLNPLQGGSDTIKSIKELAVGNPGNMPAIASNLNPFVSAGAQALSGVNLTTGAPIKTGGGLIGSVLGQTVGGLPQVKIKNLALGQEPGNRKDPHYFLTPTGQLKRKFKDSEGKVVFGPDGLPLEAADRHMLQPSLENSVLSWLGVPKRDVNLKTAQIVAKSIDSKLHPSNDFHKRKTAKKKTHHIVDLYKTK